jgi:hypothetical protein
MMPAAPTQEILLHLPRNVIEMVRTAATDRGESPDEIVAEALQFALQPLRQQALNQLKRQIRRQESQSDSELRSHIDARLAPNEEKRLTRLLERNRMEGLTDEEHTEMQRLLDRIEEAATEKAAAMWLLAGKPAESNIAR